MKANLTRALWLGLCMAVPGAVGAETLFRCVENGRTVFTDTSSGPACQGLDIRADPADPDDLARRRRDLEDWNRRREAWVREDLAREARGAHERRTAEIAAVSRPAARARGRRARWRGYP